MSNERYPEHLAISLEDFHASGWKQVLGEAAREGYPAMWHVFSDAARNAINQSRNEHSKVLWLLADACSMMLSPSSQNQPFKPCAVFDDRRSAIPDDLYQTDITFFSQIVDVVDDSRLRGRLADLVWLMGKPRSIAFALKAIDAYRALPLDLDTWLSGGRECWIRAISLVRMLKAGAGDRLEQIEASIIDAFNAATQADGYLGLWLAELLRSNGLGREARFNVANSLESSAHQFDEHGDLHRAREYFTAAADWYRAIQNAVKAAEMTVSVAEGWVKEAIARTASEGPSHMVAASFYENAIQTYRMIPRSERAVYRVDERIVELRTHLNDSGQKSLGEMGVISTPPIDISQIIDNARRSVTGKSAREAMLAFANLSNYANAEKLRDSAIQRMRRHPLQSIFASTMISRDGRVVAKRPAMSLSGDMTESDEIAIRAETIRDYSFWVSIVVHGDIWPALEILLLEHRLSEAEFIAFARQSPIVPKDRAGLFGKALFAGYERDFISALHLLIPQIEHMVRVHLKQAGAITTNLDKDGIENENGLSTLMELPEADQVFGKDLAFEIKSLFCDAFGPNLRNELAHGLLDEDGCHSPFAIYAWWLTLRLTFNTWWNTTINSNPDEDKAL
ncbi:DUF4209 domain-containing protein [Pseudomonas sp. IT-P171]|uniref:DUF4209 domain-containing protein n=1 Tax=Pseudomonas sp. IT-P171 TaxID=3026453 RepID=UPI0039DF98AA